MELTSFIAVKRDAFQILPTELCLMVLGHLDHPGVAKACRVCRHWSILASSEAVWKRLYHSGGWHYSIDAKGGETLPNPEISWRSAYAARYRLEQNWVAGKNHQATLCSTSRVCAIRLQGRYLLSGHVNGTIRRWDIANQTTTGLPMWAEYSEVRSIVLDPLNYDDVLVCGHKSGTFVVWHISPAKVLQVQKQAHNMSIEAMTLNEDFLVTGSADKTIRVWKRSISTWSKPLELVWNLIGHSAFISALRLCGNNLISASPGHCSIKAWNLMTGLCTWSYGLPGLVAYAHLDGQKICVGSQLRLFDDGTKRQVSILSDKESVTLAAQALFQDSYLRRLVTAGSQGCIIWREVEGEWVRHHRLVENSACEITKPALFRHLQVDTHRVVCCTGSDSKIVVWDFS